MKKVGIVYLITEKPEARGVLDEVTEERRKTYCEEKSLACSEVYQARASGHSPTIRLKLPQEFEYRGETICEYRGERYAILRDYTDEKIFGAELTLERIRGNAAPAETGNENPGPEDPGPEDPGSENQGSEEPENSGGEGG